MPSPESESNGAESGSAVSPMEAFKRLTQGLLGVAPDELREAERRYQEDREAAREASRGPPTDD